MTVVAEGMTASANHGLLCFCLGLRIKFRFSLEGLSGEVICLESSGEERKRMG
jgi:hypothetical protein